jgi:hypothetical protein
LTTGVGKERASGLAFVESLGPNSSGKTGLVNLT